MPWKTKDAKGHSKSVDAKKWSRVANAILKKTGNEGQAIRVANTVAKKKGG